MQNTCLQTYPCAGIWYRKEAYTKTTSEAFSCLHDAVKCVQVLPVKTTVTNLCHYASPSDMKQILAIQKIYIELLQKEIFR